MGFFSFERTVIDLETGPYGFISHSLQSHHYLVYSGKKTTKKRSVKFWLKKSVGIKETLIALLENLFDWGLFCCSEIT